MKIRPLLLILALTVTVVALTAVTSAAPAALDADGLSADGVQYITDEGSLTASVAPSPACTVTGALGIPASVTLSDKTYSVTAVAADAFAGNTAITSVTLPASIDSVGAGAFAGCASLSSVSFAGNAPAHFDASAVSGQAADFTYICKSTATGFTFPQWNALPCRRETVAVTKITLDKTELKLNQYSGPVRLNATVTPGDATDPTVVWSSSNPACVTVDQSGTVTVLTFGFSTVTASCADGLVTAKCEVSVMWAELLPSGVVMSDSELFLLPGEERSLVAIVTPEEANNKAVTWSTSDSNVVSVTSAGKLTAHKAGTAVVTVKSVVGNAVGTCTVTVVTEATGIFVSEVNAVILEGETKQLTASVLPGNATFKEVIWSSADSEIATVDENGLVTAVKIGQTTVTVSTADGKFTTDCAVTVRGEYVYVTGVTLSTDTLNLRVGDKEALEAFVTPEYATNQIIAWNSSNTRVVSVDASGNLTARNPGSALITVTTVDGGLRATCTVTVADENEDETSAPVTEPPVTEAPITSAPDTDPPVTGAPVTGTPDTDPPVTKPPKDTSDTGEPSTAEPDPSVTSGTGILLIIIIVILILMPCVAAVLIVLLIIKRKRTM